MAGYSQSDGKEQQEVYNAKSNSKAKAAVKPRNRWNIFGGGVFKQDWGYVPLTGYIRRNLTKLHHIGDKESSDYLTPIKLGGGLIAYILHVLAYQFKSQNTKGIRAKPYIEIDVDTIARDKGVTRRAIQMNTATLKEMGLLHVTYRENPNITGRNLTNLYDFTPLIKQCIVIEMVQRLRCDYDKFLKKKLSKKRNFSPNMGEDNFAEKYIYICIRTKVLIAMQTLRIAPDNVLYDLLIKLMTVEFGYHTALFFCGAVHTPPFALTPPVVSQNTMGVDKQTETHHNHEYQDIDKDFANNMSEVNEVKIQNLSIHLNRSENQIVVSQPKRKGRKSAPVGDEKPLTDKQKRIREWIEVLRLRFSPNLAEFKGSGNDWKNPVYGALIKAAKHMQTLDKLYLAPDNVIKIAPFLANDANTIVTHFSAWCIQTRGWDISNLSPMGIIKHMSEYVSFRLSAIEYNASFARKQEELRANAQSLSSVGGEQKPLRKNNPLPENVLNKYTCPPELENGKVLREEEVMSDGRIRITEKWWNASRLEVVNRVTYLNN